MVLFRDLALNGADLITVPSVFMHTTGKDHWHSLLKARAIETGCYIVAPAQYGHYLNNFFDSTIMQDIWNELSNQIEPNVYEAINHVLSFENSSFPKTWIDFNS